MAPGGKAGKGRKEGGRDTVEQNGSRYTYWNINLLKETNND